MLDFNTLINDPGRIDVLLAKVPPNPRPVRKEIFKRDQPVNAAAVKLEMRGQRFRAVPLVTRTGPGVRVGDQDPGTVAIVEPRPIRIEDQITAAEANDYQLTTREAFETYFRQKLEGYAEVVRDTLEGMCAQALTGQLNYPLVYGNSLTHFQVDFTLGGKYTPLSYTAPTLWSSGATLADVVNDLTEIVSLLQNEGFGSKVRFWAGKNVYSTLLGIVAAAMPQKKQTAITADVRFKAIDVGGFLIELADYTWFNPETGNRVAVVPDNQILVWDEDAPFRVVWAALDNFGPNRQARPLFVKSWMPPHGKWYEVLAESKPLPVPVPKAICWATVA